LQLAGTCNLSPPHHTNDTLIRLPCFSAAGVANANWRRFTLPNDNITHNYNENNENNNNELPLPYVKRPGYSTSRQTSRTPT
jgi:hypothetical protein